MGMWKRQAEAEEASREDALDLLIELDVIRECENHPGTYFEDDEDVVAAHKRANSRIKRGEIILSPGETNLGYRNRIKSVLNDNSGRDGCPWPPCSFDEDGD